MAGISRTIAGAQKRLEDGVKKVREAVAGPKPDGTTSAVLTRGGEKDTRGVVIEWRALLAPKSEYSKQTTEDAYAQDPAVGLFAVADGVGSSYRAGDWARAVVRAWVTEPFHSEHPFEVERWIRKLQPAFAVTAADLAQLEPYGQAQARQGSGCTLLGLRLWPARDQQGHPAVAYTLYAIGDSNMLHIPIRAFPVTSHERFGSYPTVLRSKRYDRSNDRVLRHPSPADDKQPEMAWRLSSRHNYESLLPGQTILLCTDATAQWCMKTDYAAGEFVAYQRLLEQTPATWPQFAQELRERREIVDDDMTVVFIRLAEDQTAPEGLSPDGIWYRARLTGSHIAAKSHGWRDARRAEMGRVWSASPRSAIDVARVYGDGAYFPEGSVATPGLMQAVQQGQAAAEALDELNTSLSEINWDNPTQQQIDQVIQVWTKHQERLSSEPTAQGALSTARKLYEQTRYRKAAPATAATADARTTGELAAIPNQPATAASSVSASASTYEAAAPSSLSGETQQSGSAPAANGSANAIGGQPLTPETPLAEPVAKSSAPLAQPANTASGENASKE